MKYSLPDSANDLLIKDGKLLMTSLSIYEVLKRFGHIIRLTPFRFEDFSASILAEDQSSLLAEIHIQLLRTLLREDRQQQTWLGPPDLRDSVNIYLHLADHSTWPAALRIYLSADPYANSSLLDLLKAPSTKDYPYNVSLEVKLDVLEQLCDQFLLSNSARDEIVNGSNLIGKRETTCRSCLKPNGDLVACGACPAVYHAKCVDTPKEDLVDTDDADKVYLCTLCRNNHIKGVSDCIDPNEESGNLKRLEALGLDKSGRRFWFLARRLFVVDEKEDDVRYYTTIKQLTEIFDSLHENRFEKSLIDNLQGMREEIERQMKITEDLYETILKDNKNEDGSYSKYLGQENSFKGYINHYSSSSAAAGKNQNSDRDATRGLSNKFCMTSINSFKWHGAINGHLTILSLTLKATILKFETLLPHTFIHSSWTSQKSLWMKSVNYAQRPEDYAIALSKLESCIRPVLFKAAWFDSLGFSQLFRSTQTEREELKKTDRQPRGFERREWFSQDFELSYRLGTMVKFSPKLKPVKHQVWKQKGEEYRLTGLNAWYWLGCTFKSRMRAKPKLYKIEEFRWLSPMNSHPFIVDMIEAKIKSTDVIDVAENLSMPEDKRILYPKKPKLSAFKQRRVAKLDDLLRVKLDAIEKSKSQTIPGENGTCKSSVTATNNANNGNNIINNTTVAANNLPQTPDKKNNVEASKKNYIIIPKPPACHDFLTKRNKIRSMLVLPDLELHKLARSGGLREARSFIYTAKQNNYVWPYGMTPRPAFRTSWLYRNRLINTMQEVALQLKVLYASIRWDDLQVRPPASGQNVITTDDATITIELLKRRERPTYSEYLIKKVTAPIEQPTKYRKVGIKSATPSARSGLRARRQTVEEEEKKPTAEEVWVSEDQLELWELKLFDEKIERQNQLIRERAFREEADRRRKLEDEKRRKAEIERRKRIEETKKARLSQSLNSTSSPGTNAQLEQQQNLTPKHNNSINIAQQRAPQPTTPVLRYFRTEQGQIIRLPASYLQRGTPLILRHVGPGPNQTNTYIIRPQLVPTTNNVAPAASPSTPAVAPLTVGQGPVATSAAQAAPELITESASREAPATTTDSEETPTTAASVMTTDALTASSPPACINEAATDSPSTTSETTTATTVTVTATTPTTTTTTSATGTNSLAGT